MMDRYDEERSKNKAKGSIKKFKFRKMKQKEVYSKIVDSII